MRQQELEVQKMEVEAAVLSSLPCPEPDASEPSTTLQVRLLRTPPACRPIAPQPLST